MSIQRIINNIEEKIGNIELTFYQNGYAMTRLKVNIFTASMIKGASAIELYADMKLEVARAVVIFINHGMSKEEFNELRKYKIYPIWDKDGFVEVIE